MRRALTISGIFIGALAALTLLAMVILPPLLTKGPMPEALVAMESTSTVTVEDGRPITFTPTGGAASGLIIYPGGFVEPRSYAPAAHALADEGIFVAIVPMPFSLAVLGSSRADGVIEDHPEITDWAIAGHSIGGVMAARYAAGHPETIRGLALWAAYPEADVDLSSWTGTTTSVFGTLDGLTSVEDIEDSRARLPSDTSFVPIEGGNHAYFGWYGDQRGDNEATITRLDQQSITVDATARVIGMLAGAG